MNNIFLSIVIPAFNVDRFLARCINSCARSTSGHGVEIIVVNDGSTDSSGDIAQQLSFALGGVRVIHQANSGVGAARNLGLQSAHGDYVWFVDGDDFLYKENVPAVIEALKERAPDVLVVDFLCVDESGRALDWISCPFERDHGIVMKGGEFFRRYYESTYAWMYVVRRELLEQNQLRFQPRISMEDAELLPRVMAVADTVYVSGIRAYAYTKRLDSAINNSDLNAREKFFRSAIEVRRLLGEFLKGLEASALREGVIAKRSAIDRILLQGYVYDALDEAALAARLELLRREGVHPFVPLAKGSIRQRMIRVGVNLYPLWFPRAYRWTRERSLFRQILARSRRASLFRL